MSRVLRVVGKRKKRRVMGNREVLRREDYEALGLDARVAMIRELVSLGLMEVYEALDEEVLRLAGEPYERNGKERHGRNPGSVRLAGQRLPIWVPRVRGVRKCSWSDWSVGLYGVTSFHRCKCCEVAGVSGAVSFGSGHRCDLHRREEFRRGRDGPGAWSGHGR